MFCMIHQFEKLPVLSAFRFRYISSLIVLSVSIHLFYPRLICSCNFIVPLRLVGCCNKACSLETSVLQTLMREPESSFSFITPSHHASAHVPPTLPASGGDAVLHVRDINIQPMPVCVPWMVNAAANALP